MAKPATGLEYKDRLLGFVDILGWTQLVERSLSDEPSRDLVTRGVDVIESGLGIQRASAAGAVLGEKWNADARYTFISDTFIMSTPAKSTNAPYFTMGLADVCCRLLELGLASRGAIVVGKLVHDGNRVYGPILAPAAHLEKCEAVVPRILVTPEASAVLSQFASFKRDADDREYLDVLHGRVLAQDHASLEVMLEHAQRNLEAARGDERVEPKYDWLVAYIRRAQAELDAARASPPKPLDLG
jgi:hypothetical protein